MKIINLKENMFLPTPTGRVHIKKNTPWEVSEKEYQFLAAIYKDCRRVPVLDKPGITEAAELQEDEPSGGSKRKGRK